MYAVNIHMKLSVLYSIPIIIGTYVFGVSVHASTASPRDISSSLNSFVRPTGIEQQTLTEATGGGLEIAFQVVGIIFFVLTIYAGILWMTAQGKEDVIEKSRNILIASTLGLIVIVSAYAFTQFITDRTTDTFASRTSAPTAAGVVDSETGEVVPTNPDGILPPQSGPGCCIRRTSNRGRNFTNTYEDLRTCEEAVKSADLGTTRGDATNDEYDWQFYTSLNAEQCTLMRSCWEIGNTSRRIECISELRKSK